jgi:hypothetical protein
MIRTLLTLAIFFGIFLSEPLSAQSQSQIQTVAGDLEIVPVRDEQWMVLGGKLIVHKYPESIVRIERAWNWGESTVCVVSADMGGSGTIPSYNILEVFRDGRYIFSEAFDSADNTFHPVNDPHNHRLKIDLGYASGRHKYAVYADHVLHIETAQPERTARTEKDCNYLYRSIYLPYVQAGLCDQDPVEVGGMSTARSFYAMQNNPNLKTDRLLPLAKEACINGRTLRYPAFRNEVCR